MKKKADSQNELIDMTDEPEAPCSAKNKQINKKNKKKGTWWKTENMHTHVDGGI